MATIEDLLRQRWDLVNRINELFMELQRVDKQLPLDNLRRARLVTAAAESYFAHLRDILPAVT